MMLCISFLERYQAGECEQVWSELIALGASVRQEPIYSDAVAVARETMHRARHNVELIANRLREIGFRFKEPGYVIEPPKGDVQRYIQRLESEDGTWPLSFYAWHEIVGGVNLNGMHKDWPYDYKEFPYDWFDPLCVDGIGDLGLMPHPRITGLVVIEFAPDSVHKAGYSGGGPYGICVPNQGADALLESDHLYKRTKNHFPYLYQAYFVNYLRECFRWGGFPNLQALPEALQPTEHLEYLTADLLQI